MESYKRDFFYGTGADINIQLGWIPDRVEIFNFTDGSPALVGYPSAKVMAFTGGGTNELKAGHKIIGATSGATATVLKVMADTGTWAAGDAAGNIIIDSDTETGTFTSESIYYEDSDGTDDATGAATANMGYDSDTEVGSFTNITPYLGTAAGNNKGFTLLLAASTNAKMFIYTAWREARD